MNVDNLSSHEAGRLFKRSTAYNPVMVKERSVGGNVLYSLEMLTNFLHLKPGMRILDLGCGKALSSVFLAKEFGVSVLAVDNFFSPSENFRFVQSQGLEGLVLPLQLNANDLPFPNDFFDCIVVVNSYSYFGTGDRYLPYIARFLRYEGQIGICDICLKKEVNSFAEVPSFLRGDFSDYWTHVHSLTWWENKWEKTGLLSVSAAEEVTDAQDLAMRQAYVDFQGRNPEEAFARALQLDKERSISFFNLVGTRNSKKAWLEETFA